jgi:aminoglycoside phosphotransferase (APT) family kinase protein
MERSLEVIAGLMSDSFLLYSKWAANSFPSGQRAAESCLTLLELRHSVIRTLTTCRTVLCFCRADPRFANVIGRPDGRVGFVDWEDCGLRDPARDLADVVTHANQEDLIAPAMWTTFLEPYLSGRAELDPELRDRMHLYLALFPLFWLSLTMRAGVSRAERGQLASWSINGRPPNWRLRRYLARATAWPSVNFAQELGKAQAISFFPGTG